MAIGGGGPYGDPFIAPAGGGLIAGGIYTVNLDPAYGTPYPYQNIGTLTYWGMSTPSAAAGPAAVATSTGVNPNETSYSLYGHSIPLSVFGVGRIGGEIIAGPWVDSGLASFIISFGVPADPSGTRDIREIAFDSEVVWTAGPGVTTLAGGTFTVEAFTARFYQGTLTQAVDTLETTHFGAKANAYRPQMLLAFSNLPLAGTKFNKIPYVAAVIGDGTGDALNFGEAFERLAYSPWVGWTSAQFETSGITDGVASGGMIIAQESQFLPLIQQFGRFYPKWDILQTDKLRIRDRGAVTTFDINLDKTTLTGGLTLSRAEPNSVPKILELSTIDPNADYTIVPSRAQTPLAPVAVSSSVKTDKAYLPVIMDASTRASIVTYTKYHEEVTRKKISFAAMAYGLEIEPGDFVAITGLGDDFQNEIFRVIETLHGANYVVEVTAESILNCTFGSCTEAALFLERTSGLDDTHVAAYIDLICGLVTDGIWAKLDALYVLATQDSTTAKLNLVSSSFNLIARGAPTFTADRGFTGVAASATVYLDTGFKFDVGTPKFSAPDSAHISLWSVTDVGGVAQAPMGQVDPFGRLNWLNPKYTDNHAHYRVLSQAVGDVANTTPTGHYLANRSAQMALQGYKNGAQVLTDTTLAYVTPLAGNNSTYLLGVNNNGTPLGSPHQVAMASIGGSLDATESLQFYTRLRAYMTAVGVP